MEQPADKIDIDKGCCVMIQYPVSDLITYFFLYALLGWGIQVACAALKDRRYVNRGLLNLPFAVPSGITAVILLLALPTLDGLLVLQFAVCWVVMEMVSRFAEQFVKNISRRSAMGTQPHQKLPFWAGLILSLAEALAYLIVYLVIHPFVYTFVNWLPNWFVLTAAITLSVLTAVDYIGVRHTLRTHQASKAAQERKAWTQRMADRMGEHIWKRLEKAYPGVERIEPENRSRYVFAKGICFDKLVWVFLVTSFLGAMIEMVFCFVTGGQWMNRSSVLYGSFSFVWGFGAVVLTVVLQRLAGKEDRKVFLAGFVVGGAYEYLCSVFTEIVFGTVFWDYSEMPLNIGGRTNVLYCIFWGLLAVVWIKVLYPPMERGIEKFPPLLGKIVTWVVVFVMLCDGLLTVCAMCRYTQRQTAPEPSNVIEEFLDARYDDAWMEKRWPNMEITDSNEGT